MLRPGAPPRLVLLGSADEIDRLVAQWRRDIAAEVTETAAAAGGTSRLSGAAVRRRIWDPLGEQLEGITRVFIVPDGSLNLVPFAALPVGPVSFLIERGPMLHYLTAERDLIATRRTNSTGRGLLALGGAAFDRSAAQGRRAVPPSADSNEAATGVARVDPCAFASIRFPPLTGTLQEVRQIATLWAGSVHADESAQLHVGRYADEAAFKHDAPGHRVLHLATHGFFLDDSCRQDIAGTRALGRIVPTGTSAAPARLDHQIPISGLALAGANRRAAVRSDGGNETQDDGILTADEVTSIDLDGVEWAVLSACETGVGELKAGEGVMGLRRSFLVAGARTVIMSLWSVDDRAALAWMRSLYDARFVRGLTSDEAVQSASLAALRDRRAKRQPTLPFYWAAFVAVGDWR